MVDSLGASAPHDDHGRGTMIMICPRRAPGAEEIPAMTDDPRRRALMRHGFRFVLLAPVFGVAIAVLPHPSRWLAAHLTAFLTGIILVVMALVWNELRLTKSQLTLAYATGLIAAYGGLVGNVFGAITDLPGPASNPGVIPPMPQALVSYCILAIVVPSVFVSFGLVLFGMRGAAGAHPGRVLAGPAARPSGSQREQ